MNRLILAGAALAIVAGVGAASFYSISNLTESLRKQDEIDKKIGNLEKIIANLKDAETGQRGYIITGNQEYLEPYQKALDFLHSNEEQKFLSDLGQNDDLKNQMQRLNQLIKNKISELKYTIDLRQTQGFDAAKKEVEGEKGKKIMDEIRSMISELIQQRKLAFEKEEKNLSRNVRRTLFLIVFGDALAFLILAISLFRLYNEIRIRRKAEFNLVSANKLNKAIVESAKQAIITIDLQGNIVSFNRGAELLFGHSSRDLIGRSIFDFYNKAALEGRLKQLSIKRGDHIIEELEALVSLSRFDADEPRTWEVKRKDGTTFDFEQSTISLRNEEGHPFGFLIIGSDVTARKKEELLLVQAEERAVKSNLSKSRFLLNLSESLKHSINDIIESAKKVLGNKSSEQIQNNLNVILEEGKKLKNAVLRIEELSQAESGEFIFRDDLVNIEDLIDSISNEFKKEAEDKNLNLITEVPTKLGPLKTDSEKLKKIISNLVENAIKFTHEGYVKIRVIEDPILHLPKRIDVIDTGKGLDKDSVENISEMLFKPLPKKPTEEEFGLGLAISNAFCNMMNYKISFHSVTDRGSTFSVDLQPK